MSAMPRVRSPATFQAAAIAFACSWRARISSTGPGRTWSRACDRQTFLPLGPEGSWEPDYSEINHAGPLLVDDELWFFYRGSTMLGHRHPGSGRESPMAMGLATLRRDGFASLVADRVPGHNTTRPLAFGGQMRYVNAAVAAGGRLRVAILDRDAQPLPGFSAEHCRPLTGDSTAMPVIWETGALSELTAEPVRLRFDLETAQLYSFWVA